MLSMVVILVATVFTSSVLQLTSTITSGQAREVDDMRAFYLAEAGLSEAFEALRVGRRGQIGSIDAPTRYGDGIVWVDATPTPDNQMRLESTAICGRGVQTLALIVEPLQVELGIFSDEPLVVEQSMVLDGIAPTPEPEPDPGGTFEVDWNSPDMWFDYSNHVFFYEGVFYSTYLSEGNTMYYEFSFTVAELSAHPEFGLESTFQIAPSDFVGPNGVNTQDFASDKYTGVLGYYAERRRESLTTEVYMDSDMASLGYGSFTTSYEPNLETGPTLLNSTDGLLGSNGEITIGGAGESVEIYGDVVPGSESQVIIGSGGFVSGDTAPRAFQADLPEVEVPQLSLGVPIDHTSPVPLILSPGDHGFEALSVGADAELLIRGPATVVVGELALATGASLTLDTTDGAVELFVTTALRLEPDSLILTPNQAPNDVSVQVSADDRWSQQGAVELRSTTQFYGTIYAPDANVTIGSAFELFGSVAARVLNLEPGARLHYDGTGNSNMPTPVSWQIVEVPPEVRAGMGDLAYGLGVDRDQLVAMADAHDLGGINLVIEYVDRTGTTVSYSGPEQDFAWDQVDSVVQQSRDGWDDWQSGWWNDWWDNWGADWWANWGADWTDSWGSNWGSNWGNGDSQGNVSAADGDAQ